MNKRVIIILGLVAILFPVVIYSETYWGGELPNVNNTVVKGEVSLNGDIYTYSYTVISGSNNTGQIGQFLIDIRKPAGGVELSGEGLVNLKDFSAEFLSVISVPKVIPVGFYSPSSDWVSGVDIFGQASWGGEINPGQSISGFQLTSRGLPGIMDCKVAPELIPPKEEDPISVEEIRQTRDQASFKGKTLGPTAPPSPFDPVKFLKTIRGYVNESATLGWLIDPNLKNTLLAQLNTAESFLNANDPSRAKAVLQEFMTTIADAPSNQRTAEAYGLLYFNAKYLKEQLPNIQRIA